MLGTGGDPPPDYIKTARARRAVDTPWAQMALREPIALADKMSGYGIE